MDFSLTAKCKFIVVKQMCMQMNSVCVVCVVCVCGFVSVHVCKGVWKYSGTDYLVAFFIKIHVLSLVLESTDLENVTPAIGCAILNCTRCHF